MIIKKFIAETEKEAVDIAKAELGEQVTIMSVKENIPHGFFKFLKKSTVEVTAAVDEEEKKDENIIRTMPRRERTEEKAPDFSALQQAIENSSNVFSPAPDSKAAMQEANRERMINSKEIIADDEEDTSADSNVDLEQRLSSLQELIEKQMQSAKEEEKEEQEQVIDKNQSYLNLIRRQLVDNEVEPDYIEQILDEISGSLTQNSTLENILASVYQKIVLKIGTPHLIDLRTEKTKYIFFIGSTGVGKTTTIAKLASTMKLTKKSKVALITSDTYRIAAVEQLRTYANILGIPLKVVYSAEEMPKVMGELKDFDIVMVDTAGRSHNNLEQKEDIEKILKTVPDEDKEVFLVLSAATKYKDLVKITNSYSEICKYNLLFTKIDETDTIGNIFNTHILTGAPLSYATWGQNVPDDIGKIDAQKIARQLLGG